MADTQAKNQPQPEMPDILIAGGGYVGLSVGLAIASAGADLSIIVVDGAPEHVAAKDERASAIAAAARRMLTELGVWSHLESYAQPITDMIVTDSRLDDVKRPIFLTFANEADAVKGGDSLAWMLENRYLVAALRKACIAAGVGLVHGEMIQSVQAGPDRVAVIGKSGRKFSPRLLVAADGANSAIREMIGIRTVRWRYDQKAIVTTIAHERPHNGRAEEHFLPAGPFAILPLTGNRSSLVWTEPSGNAERLLALDDVAFELELERRFGHHLGHLSVVGNRRNYPLGLTLARDFVRDRIALAGDAAHGIHPISGQGLNLGFKDAAALAETVVEADRLGLDIGSLSVLEDYQRWRRFDTVQMGVVTDVLNRLFSNDLTPVRLIRDLGLGIVDRLPGLKRRFIGEAAGISGRLPKLLDGKAI